MSDPGRYPLYIFDLDGTLSLSTHRAHFLGNRDDPERWDKWHAACVDDPLNEPVAAVFMALEGLADRWIWTGRSDSVLDATVAWLKRHFGAHVLRDVRLRMRPHGDHTEDTKLKTRWYNETSQYDRARLRAVFEDRARMVAAWRALGVPCFQVAPGEF